MAEDPRNIPPHLPPGPSIPYPPPHPPPGLQRQAPACPPPAPQPPSEGRPPIFPPVPPLPAVRPPPIPFDNGITDIPCHQDFPDNGPYRPPPPHGRQPTQNYEFIVVPRPCPIPPEAPYYCAFGTYQQIEYQFALLNVYAERTTYWNGVRVYRVPIQYIWKFPYDCEGPFMGYDPQPVFRFLLENPLEGQNRVDYWAPVLA